MPFNKDISGYKNEFEFVQIFNRKKVKNLNPIYQSFLFDIFDNISYDDYILAELNFEKQKADIFIYINNQKKSISIKKGIKNSVHVEHVFSFVKFLKQNNIQQSVIEELLLYHYADGSKNGSGENRISSEEYKQLHQKSLDYINKAFNQPDFLKKVIDRFVLTGTLSNNPVDAIIYGVIDDFIWIKKDEIIKIITSKKDLVATGVHFGSLFYQPQNRCLNRNPKYEKERHYIQIKWYHLADDIIEAMNQRNKLQIS